MTLRYEKEHLEPAVDANFSVLHVDDDILVVDKPAHLPMHADGPFIRNTLIHLLRTAYGNAIQLVHRLDRETSGVVVAARSKAAQAAIQRQFGVDIEKTYLAVVDGLLPGALICQQAIGHHRDSSVRLRRSAAGDARDPQQARTEVEVVEHGPRRTLVRCRPATGRTHQIRVHLEHHGHPVVGDKLYGCSDDSYLSFVRKMKNGGSVFDAVAIQAHPELASITHVHHAGNSSGIVDGAAAVLIGNRKAGRKAGLTPRARIRAFANIGSEPALMLTGPVDVTEKLLASAKMSLKDIDLFEINEAFASVVLRYRQAFDLDPAVVNVNGGAIAMGHPLGATGAMILGTVLDELERRDLNTALVTLCIGAGMGTATIIERV